MENQTKKINRKIVATFCIACFTLLLTLGQLGWQIYTTATHNKSIIFWKNDDDKKIQEIGAYLDNISPEFIATVKALSQENNIPSWGCGPSSYALAKILNQKFFNNELPIGATYHGNTHEIVERFSFAFQNPESKKDQHMVDHAWLEIYFDNRFMYIDPTIGQFGNYDKIVYEVFKVGDPEVQTIMLQKYGLADIRLKVLVQKVVNRVPPSQEPYPGMTIDPSMIDYYLQSVQERDQVDHGDEPAGWQAWIATLLSLFA
ncbi:hypothetical protein IPF86_01150 [Candidatus Nomurabacteria bacterium]|jgi:hypothetical protein|nr:MAG: hypothetical protein IPF86_01150 [Candidatus Nomurabacteria bacterium]